MHKDTHKLFEYGKKFPEKRHTSIIWYGTSSVEALSLKKSRIIYILTPLKGYMTHTKYQKMAK